MEPMKFSWFPKLSRALEKMPDEEMQAEFCRAVVMYGSFGIEPELSFPLDMVFETVREDIDNSVRSSNGNSGGRPNKKQQEKVVSEDAKPPVSNCRKPPVSKDAKPLADESGNPSLYTNPCHTNPIHTMPCQEGERAHAPAPPTLDEVRDYFAANCLKGDPELFYAHHSERGWKTKDGLSIEDWHGSAMKWHLREPEFERSRRSCAEADRLRLERAKPPEEREPVARLPDPVNGVDWEEEARKMGVDLDG